MVTTESAYDEPENSAVKSEIHIVCPARRVEWLEFTLALCIRKGGGKACALKTRTVYNIISFHTAGSM